MLRLTNQDLTVKKTRGVKKAARAGKSVLKDAPREDAPREKEKDLSPESLEALEEALAGKGQAMTMEEFRAFLAEP